MPRRASNWVLHQNKKGDWDLSKGGRFYYTGMSSQAACVARMKNYFKDGEQVFLEEPDGYRTNITARLKKSGIL
jgi:predicted metal-dependent hydrolase